MSTKIKTWEGIGCGAASITGDFDGVAGVGPRVATTATGAAIIEPAAASSQSTPIPADRALQLAAKAAGFTNRLGWAPRDDDAQAFELAVVLGMTVSIDKKAGTTHVSRGDLSTIEAHQHDARRATRNAITTLAAFIGANTSRDASA